MNFVSGMKLIKQKKIKTKDDILGLDIIDFNKLNGTFQNPAEALNTIYSWFRLGAVVSIIDSSEVFWKVKKRNDFPEWEHTGDHVRIGKQYWNFFWAGLEGAKNTWLQFSDSPDFFGMIEGNTFFGDIGKVSASAFAISQKAMHAGSLWISVQYDGDIQILIEPLVDINEIFGNLISEDVVIPKFQHEQLRLV